MDEPFRAISCAASEAFFFHAVALTRERYGEVDVALGIDRKSRERWIIVSDVAPVVQKPLENTAGALTLKKDF